MDSPAWSLLAWVQLPKNGGANILRKPLGKSQAEMELSCWSWHVGNPSDRLDFGAHDFRGGTLTSELHESILANTSAAADGALHHVALVVTPSNVTFYMDAKVQVTQRSHFSPSPYIFRVDATREEILHSKRCFPPMRSPPFPSLSFQSQFGTMVCTIHQASPHIPHTETPPHEHSPPLVLDGQSEVKSAKK